MTNIHSTWEFVTLHDAHAATVVEKGLEEVVEPNLQVTFLFLTIRVRVYGR